MTIEIEDFICKVAFTAIHKKNVFLFRIRGLGQPLEVLRPLKGKDIINIALSVSSYCGIFMQSIYNEFDGNSDTRNDKK